jgi:hypothetical protein
MVLDLRATLGDGGRGGAGGVGTTCERVNSGRTVAVVKVWRELKRSIERKWWVEGGNRANKRGRSRGVAGEEQQSFTNLLYGGHEGGETSTVVSWLCVIHKRIAVGCRWRLSCMGGNFDIGFCGDHGR